MQSIDDTCANLWKCFPRFYSVLFCLVFLQPAHLPDHEVFYPGLGILESKRFQSTERGRSSAEKMLAVRTKSGRTERTREFTREAAAHSQAGQPFPHICTRCMVLPPSTPAQQGGLSCPAILTPTTVLCSLFPHSSFSAVCIPVWPKADIFALSIVSMLKKSRVWVQLRLGCSSCIWRQLIHPSKVHDVSANQP